MWTIFKVFTEFVTILLLFYVLGLWPGAMWDLSSPTRDRTRTPCIGRQSLNHWTTREVPNCFFWFATSQSKRSFGLKQIPFSSETTHCSCYLSACPLLCPPSVLSLARTLIFSSLDICKRLQSVSSLDHRQSVWTAMRAIFLTHKWEH